MADHFGNEILFLVITITFITLLLASTTISFSETRIAAEEMTKDTTFDTSWENTGNNFWALGDYMPLEFFLLFIMPLIVLVGYIVLKTASGLLPNWLSGG